MPPSACVALRRAVDAAVVSGSKPHGTDTVDGAPDFQVNLTVDQMSDLVGIANMLHLGSLVERFGASSSSLSSSSSSSSSAGAEGNSSLAATEAACNFLKQAEQQEGLEMFVRRYSSAGRCVLFLTVALASQATIVSFCDLFNFSCCLHVILSAYVQTLDSILL